MNARATAVEAWRSLRASASACESWQHRSTSITQGTLPPARDRLTAVGGTARRIPATIPQERAGKTGKLNEKLSNAAHARARREDVRARGRRRMAPSDSLRFFLRSSLTLGSLFAGAGIAHAILKPDMVRLARHAPPIYHERTHFTFAPS